MTTVSGTSVNERERFDEFSPKKIVQQIEGGISYLWSKWLVIIGCGIALGLLYVALNFSKKPIYTAEMSFALDEGAVKSSGSSFSSLSEELGFGPSYEAGGVFSSMTNIMELMQSRLLVEKALKRSVVMYGKPVLFANFFLDSLNFRKKWMKGSPYYNLDFLKINPSREEEIFRNGILNAMYTTITKQFVKIDKKGKGTTLINVTLTSENEAFSKYFLEALVEEVSKFYIEIKTYRSKLHLDFIQLRTDSVRIAYTEALYGRATYSDANINLGRQIAVVPGEKKQTDIQILRDNYINLVKSLESARTSLMQDTPLFQYLDTPVFPLKMDKKNLLVSFVLFSIIGCVITCILLLLVRLYRFIMLNED